jgi:hypothetical protein
MRPGLHTVPVLVEMPAFDFGCIKTMEGRVAEWFKAHAWKVCVR